MAATNKLQTRYQAGRLSPVAARRYGGLLLALAAGIAVYLLTASLALAARQTTAIFAVAITLWVTEAVPLYATSLIIVFLEVVLLGREGGSLGLTGAEYRIFLQPFFDPAVVLMLGGLGLSAALAKYKLDSLFAAAILRRLPATPGAVLAGFMLVTAVLSMWMSNTAATALGLAIIAPALKSIPEDDPWRSALVLAIPFAANLGGMATPVGTPPNAIALGALNRIGARVSFLQWMTIAVPLVLVLMVATWFILLRVFKPRRRVVHITMPTTSEFRRERVLVLVVMTITVLLWFTGAWHGIPDGIVALVPLILFFGSRILDSKDMNALGWDVLLIIGGGLSLSAAFQASGLSEVIVGLLHTSALPAWELILLVTIVSVLLSTVISHTAAISLLMPVVISLGGGWVVPAAVAAALASSVGLGLPVSNAPNSMAYGTGLVSTGSMAKSGFPLSLLGTVLITAVTALWVHLL